MTYVEIVLAVLAITAIFILLLAAGAVVNVLVGKALDWISEFLRLNDIRLPGDDPKP